jgi:predicted lipid-binding transport protein (Tim44 family)
MPSDMKQIALVVFATLAAACSSTPATSPSRTDEPAVGTAAPPAAPQTLAATGNAPVIAPRTASTAAAAPASVVDASLIKAGYSVMRRHDEILYCRNEVITGQRIGTRICLTAGQIQDEKQNVTKAKDLLNLPSNRCLGASCNN